eukprot:GHVQ01025606.1.p1 GENE.GHVQ01025606.1~~GHVQ01025606.1.p1  ORF type:complete len:153 (-),score=16.79 GHVQ01025606.1:6-464(-)
MALTVPIHHQLHRGNCRLPHIFSLVGLIGLLLLLHGPLQNTIRVEASVPQEDVEEGLWYGHDFTTTPDSLVLTKPSIVQQQPLLAVKERRLGISSLKSKFLNIISSNITPTNITKGLRRVPFFPDDIDFHKSIFYMHGYLYDLGLKCHFPRL